MSGKVTAEPVDLKMYIFSLIIIGRIIYILVKSDDRFFFFIKKKIKMVSFEKNVISTKSIYIYVYKNPTYP